MLVSRVGVADLVALGERDDWKRETIREWPVPRSPNEYVIIWMDENPRLPRAIVVPTSVEEFYAWSATYLVHLTPLSSLVRVVSTTGPGTLKSVAPVALPGAFGLVIAEIAAANDAKLEDGVVSFAEAMSTLSYALLAAVVSGEVVSLRAVSRSWLEARSLLELREPPFFAGHITDVWESAIGDGAGLSEGPAIGQVGNLFDHKADAVHRGIAGDTESVFAALSERDQVLVRELREGPLEDRIGRYKELARRLLAERHRDDTEVSRLLGASLSRVSGGTFKHSHLVGPDEVPDVRPLLWYGWFEALAAGTSGLPWFGGALGLRLLQDLTRSHGAAENCDVALDELRVLRRGTREPPRLNTRHLGYVRVQLYESVVAEFPLVTGRREQKRGGRDK